MRIIALFLLVILINPFCLLAQETTGGISGMVTDDNGTELEFATVVVTDVMTNAVNSVYSQANGSYHFPNLTPSTYVIEISFIGYQSVVSDVLKVRLGKETIYNATLYSESTQLSEIKITESRVVKDGKGYVVDADAIDDIPVLYRSIQELSRINPESNLNSFGGSQCSIQ